MAEVNYQEAKKTIDDFLEGYAEKSSSEILPKFEFQKEEKISLANIALKKSEYTHQIINAFTNTLGEMKVRSYTTELVLEKEKTRISISPCAFFGGIRLRKEGDLTHEEIQTLIDVYKIINPVTEKEDPRIKLSGLGVIIHEPDKSLDWNYLAGYEEVKKEIHDTLILPLRNPEIYDQITSQTRKRNESIRPKAVLFEGNPGTGKTVTAKIIAGQIDAPLLYIPIESIMTKWFGESERNLAEIFKVSRELEDPLLFLDEIDSLSTSRDQNVYEATRRVLSVLLREIDGFEQKNKGIIIGATNRKTDLDSALLSRFDVSIHFPLPNENERYVIFQNYAKQLSLEELSQVAKYSENTSGRNIKDICEYAERRWASKLILGKVQNITPPVEEYLEAIKVRSKNGI